MIVSELILNGVLHLFALLSSCHDPFRQKKARENVAAYLSDHLGIVNTAHYLGLFDSLLDFYGQGPEKEALISQTQAVCGNLKGHIPRTEQYVVLFRFFVLARSLKDHDSNGLSLLAEAVGKSFDIERSIVKEMLDFLNGSARELKDSGNLLIISSQKAPCPTSPWLRVANFSGVARVLRIQDIDTFFLAPKDGEFTLDGTPLKFGDFYPLPVGAILRDVRGVPAYYADIAARFIPHTPNEALIFEARNVDFRFPGCDNGLHDFCYHTKGGKMIGVMGGSGVGKSTLASILNGTMPPQSGRILVNGRDLYQDSHDLEGIIGFVPQDDLLFDELTVYENLYYSSRLCLSHMNKTDLDHRVKGILEELHQVDIMDLKMGSPLKKTVSGGQRKRLNIALELIREPSILFVDEPTSGLSSADSLNVITLLKEQSNRGKLIIVIIHQPSSEIFKLFDDLWILDKGGRPIYTGNPIDALIYFRRSVWQAGTEECVCPKCGNVNPEQIFDIIEMKNLDERGYASAQRRFSPEDWHARYLTNRPGTGPPPEPSSLPPKALHRPGLMGQLAIFFKRNLLARMANRQYLVINLLEAPFLAWVIAFVAKYETNQGYLFFDNHSIPVYFFMSVIVSLFMGLSVSAEEIIQDRKILSRERFLHLSWFSYISAKVLYLGMVAAIQMGLYVIVGNTVLEVHDFSMTLWTVLFSCAMCASMIGLNISAAFKTVVTIYILIPLLLVPQIIMGGMIISFDDLIASDTPHNRVPVLGNLMPSRWGFEAAAVAQFRNNQFQAPYNELDQQILEADYYINYYLPELRSKIDCPFLATSGSGLGKKVWNQKITEALVLLKYELNHLIRAEGLGSPYPSHLFTRENYSREKAKEFNSKLTQVSKTYQKKRREADKKRRLIEERRMAEMGEDNYLELEKKCKNKTLVDLVKNRENLDDYRLTPGKIVRLSDPVFTRALTPWGTAPMFAGQKKIGPFTLSTLVFNQLVLWLAAMLLYAALYWNLLTRFLDLAAVTPRAMTWVIGRSK